MELSIIAVVLLIMATVGLGTYGLRFSRTTSDFFVASRSVSPWVNASAISGEYLSAASFMGIAGLVMSNGIDMLWYPVGFTVGYLVMLILVAAPLRRSGAYTLPDFAEIRMESHAVRRVASIFAVLIAWLYLLPQMHAAGLTLRWLTGAPRFAGALVVALIVGITVAIGGMRSITIVQSFQYWMKLFAIALPAGLIAWAWTRDGSPSIGYGEWGEPLSGFTNAVSPLYLNVSLVLATFLGTMGLPHVLVRFNTVRDGRAARRTAFMVLIMLSSFYLFPPILGALGRHYTPELAGTPAMDTVVLALPSAVFPGFGGELLSALAAAGAFAAFLSTASGLTLSVAGVLSQDLLRRRVGSFAGFRLGTAIAISVPLGLSWLAGDRATLGQMTAMAFAVAASTFSPLLVLGIWWRGLTVAGAIAGLVVGGTTSFVAVCVALFSTANPAWHMLIVQPAAWTVPLSFATMYLVSRFTPSLRPPHAHITLGRLHTPDALAP